MSSLFSLLLLLLSTTGARFNFKLDEDLKEAASDVKVRDALMSKISRERIGHEVFYLFFYEEQSIYCRFVMLLARKLCIFGCFLHTC